MARTLNTVAFATEAGVLALLLVSVLSASAGTITQLSRDLHPSKPAAFALAFLAVGFALWALEATGDRPRSRTYVWAVVAFNVAAAIDTVIIFVQQQRGVPSHFNHVGTLSVVLTSVMSALSFVLFASAIVWTAELLRSTRGQLQSPSTAVFAKSAAVSALTFLLGIAVGFVMIAIGYFNISHGVALAHAVNVFDMDVRIAHATLLLQFPMTVAVGYVGQRIRKGEGRSPLNVATIVIGSVVLTGVLVTLAFRAEQTLVGQ